MSDLVSALGGVRYDGVVAICECAPTGMIVLRGDFSDPVFVSAIKNVSGLSIPAQRKTVFSDDTGLLWMSPDELMLLVPYAKADNMVTDLNAALGGLHTLVTNVSDARAMLEIQGPALREVLAKLSPVDMSPLRFGPGDVRRTRMAQVAAAFWLDDAMRARVVCFRSVARYVFGLLANAADPAAELQYFE